MAYKFNFRPYQRKFARSLATNHGIWDIREGIILSLSNETGSGLGEIAPISWFGSETLEQALDFCHQLPAEITDETIFSIPDELPACQFGFESALERIGNGELGTGNWEWGIGNGRDNFTTSNSSLLTPNSSLLTPNSSLLTPHSSLLSYSGLLPPGEAVLSEWEKLWQQDYRTFKWKIGVYAIAHELEIFNLLTQTLPASTKLRLDANGGLSYEDTKLWLFTCDHIQANQALSLEIEFLEQPLPVGQFKEMLELSKCYETRIALDESVATLKQLAICYSQGWRDIFVIKPGIVGSPFRLRQFCQQYKIDAVFSSVFETAIGRQAALQLAAELSLYNRAVGFGINHFFEQ